jgi:hypothetical protein
MSIPGVSQLVNWRPMPARLIFRVHEDCQPLYDVWTSRQSLLRNKPDWIILYVGPWSILGSMRRMLSGELLDISVTWGLWDVNPSHLALWGHTWEPWIILVNTTHFLKDLIRQPLALFYCDKMNPIFMINWYLVYIWVHLQLALIIILPWLSSSTDWRVKTLFLPSPLQTNAVPDGPHLDIVYPTRSNYFIYILIPSSKVYMVIHHLSTSVSTNNYMYKHVPNICMSINTKNLWVMFKT